MGMLSFCGDFQAFCRDLLKYCQAFSKIIIGSDNESVQYSPTGVPSLIAARLAYVAGLIFSLMK